MPEQIASGESYTVQEENKEEAEESAVEEVAEEVVSSEVTAPQLKAEAVAKTEPAKPGVEIIVFVNGEPVPMTGKEEYIFVDIFDRITFDLNAGRGRAIATILNGRDALFTEKLHHGDKVELYWKEK